MFAKGIEKMGGMKRFVKKGQIVVLKPNIGFDSPPEHGATTHPGLVRAITEQCLYAGARKVYVFDNVAATSYGLAKQCYEKSGIAWAAGNAGAVVVQGDHDALYHEVKNEKASLLQFVKVHELILESDVFINIPVLKNHRHAHMTGAMKNLMGVVWDRMAYHFSGLDKCIAEFCLYKKPDLNVIDAYRVMMQNGPRGQSPNDTVLKKTLLLSTDILAADAAAALVYGIQPEKVAHIKWGNALNIGNMNLEKLNIAKIAL